MAKNNKSGRRVRAGGTAPSVSCARPNPLEEVRCGMRLRLSCGEMPGRRFLPSRRGRSATATTQYFDYLRAIDGSAETVKQVKAWILEEYRKATEAAA